MPLVCWVKKCSKTRETVQRFLDHLRNGHSIHYSNVEVRCGQEGCPGTFVGFRALKRHLLKCHSHLECSTERALQESVFGLCQPETAEVVVDNDDVDVASECDMQEEDNDTTDITSSCMSFLGQLQSRANVSVANVQIVSECLKILLIDVKTNICSRVAQLCHDTNIDVSGTPAQSCYNG